MSAIIQRRAQRLQRSWSTPAQKPAGAPAADDVESIDQFAAREAACARHGGLVRADELVQQMRHQWEQPMSVLARWIVSRAMISLDRHSDILIPMFQIDPCSGGLSPGCRAIVAELRDVMNNWEMARWFAASDPCLGGRAPVDMLPASWRDVFNAARVARFVARG